LTPIIPAWVANLKAPARGARARRDGVGGQPPARFGRSLLAQLALPGQQGLGGHIPHPACTEVRPHVPVCVVPVVEAGLGREPTVGVQAIQVQVKQLVDGGASSGRLEPTRSDLVEELSAGSARLGRCLEAPPGHLHPTPS
jgi:hypothetical protein